jgi:polyphenol oxidase
MKSKLEFIIPDWPAPKNVHALQTTRNKANGHAGYSHAPYDSLNFGMHVKDNPIHVALNRQLLSEFLPSEPVWLNQVHGVHVVDAAQTNCVADADASFSTKKNVVCVTMTADCLPVLLCDVNGTVVSAVHAGWRGLCDGVLEASIHAVCRDAKVESNQLMAWFGPAIGSNAFEVGDEVRQQFMAIDARAELAFVKNGDKYLGDLYKIATQRLNNLGVTKIYGGGRCTFTEKDQFFSFRRDGDTGRMATLIWLA